MMSLIGETSSLAATLGRRPLEKAEAPATMWLNLNLSWEATNNGVSFSGKNPSNAAFSATNTLVTPFTPATSLATSPHLEPATRQVMSPPMVLAAVMALRVTGERLALSCSASTRVEAGLERLVRGRISAGLRLSIVSCNKSLVEVNQAIL